MGYKKLTYGGEKCNNYLYFAFDAEHFDLEQVTKRLNLEPTSIMIKKNPVPKSTSWKYEFKVGDEIDLVTPLEKLIDLFEPKIKMINKIKEELHLKTRLQFVIDIDIDPEASTPFFGLNKRTVAFLSKTETEVDFDIYKADKIGFLEK
ncbi:MAG: DUF4279 domain-containing protein [Bacteroidota bacterium]